MSNLDTLHTLISLFQDQGAITNGLWAVYTVTTFTAAAFSFKNHPEGRQRLMVFVGYLAFTLGHLALVLLSVDATGALADAIKSLAEKIEKTELDSMVGPSVDAAKSIAATADPILEIRGFGSVITHLVIDICVCLLIFSGRNSGDEKSEKSGTSGA